MENFKQALAYLKTALLFDPIGEEYLLDRASIFYDLGLDDQACADWDVAQENGSLIAERAMKTNCRSYKPKVDVPVQAEETDSDEDDFTSNGNSSNEEEDYTQNGSDDKDDDYTSNGNSSDDEEDYTDNSDNEDPVTEEAEVEEEDSGEYSSDNDSTATEEEEEEEVEDSYPLDDTVEEIYIDDELTIILADGIGSRKLIEKPDILILSDKSGEVVVNVCIDRLGRVQNPTLNEEYSTIAAPSLISLAIRESSNFRFARSSRKSHCGTITYDITGTE